MKIPVQLNDKVFIVGKSVGETTVLLYIPVVCVISSVKKVTITN